MILTKQVLEKKVKDSEYNPHAAYEVGEHYYSQGEYEKAVHWYHKAVAGADPDPLACYALGYAFQVGQGTSMDLIQALHYYEMAAMKNLPQACYNLAYFYQNGIGVARNQKLADRYSERALECLTRQAHELQSAKAGLLELQRVIEAQKRNYDILLKTHQKALYMVDEQKNEHKKLTSELEKWIGLYRKEEGKNVQLAKEKEDLLQLIRYNQNQLLDCQRLLEEEKNKVKMMNQNRENRMGYLQY